MSKKNKIKKVDRLTYGGLSVGGYLVRRNTLKTKMGNKNTQNSGTENGEIFFLSKMKWYKKYPYRLEN